MLGLPACISPKKWPTQRYLLERYEIRGTSRVPVYELEYLLQQKPNRRIGPLKPYLWLYQVGQAFFHPEKIKAKSERLRRLYSEKIQRAESARKDRRAARLQRKFKNKADKLALKQKEGNWLMRAVGEAPVFYDSLKTQRTAGEMRQYLQNHGFFQGQVRVDTFQLKKKQRVKVVYNIQEHRPSFLGEIHFVSDDARMDSLLRVDSLNSLLKKDAPYDASRITAEQQRIEKWMQNNGYLYFSRQYLTAFVDTLHFGLPSMDTLRALRKDSLAQLNLAQILADTLFTDSLRRYTQGERKAQVEIRVSNPAKGPHKVYHLDQVYFHVVNSDRRLDGRGPSFDVRIDTLISPQTGVRYVYEGGRFAYNYRIFDRRMRFQSQKLYRQDDFLSTQNAIGLLDIFKFVNIYPDTTGGRLKIDLFTTPLERYQLTDEIGVNIVQGGLPGPYLNISFKNRNTFRGAELFENSLRFAIDGQTSFADEGVYSSQEVGFSSSLTFPRVLFPFGLVPRRLRENVDFFNPITKLSLSFNYVRRPEYTRTNLAAAISYQGQIRNSTYNLTLAELSVVNTRDISLAFNEQLEALTSQGNPIFESFDRALVSSLSFNYTYQRNPGQTDRRSVYFRVLLESGGTTLNLLRSTGLIVDNRIFGLKIFQYWRINPTFHYFIPLSKPEQALAFRANAGVAFSYGASNTLPYEKFYFSGGSNSIRAWQPRRLGPGAARPEVQADGTFDYRFEEPGEVILEANAEYRFPLFGFVKGAVFIDAGNVWKLKDDPNEPEGKFRITEFYKQIAIGTGFGIRLNLSFLLLRFDFGLKVYDPARRPDRRWVIGLFNPLRPFEKQLLLWNLGIGYPF
ncbi:MAG: BamA/TamA family outer membrane protein [Microscillaceae bacterium]